MQRPSARKGTIAAALLVVAIVAVGASLASLRWPRAPTVAAGQTGVPHLHSPTVSPSCYPGQVLPDFTGNSAANVAGRIVGLYASDNTAFTKEDDDLLAVAITGTGPGTGDSRFTISGVFCPKDFFGHLVGGNANLLLVEFGTNNTPDNTDTAVDTGLDLTILGPPQLGTVYGLLAELHTCLNVSIPQGPRVEKASRMEAEEDGNNDVDFKVLVTRCDNGTGVTGLTGSDFALGIITEASTTEDTTVTKTITGVSGGVYRLQIDGAQFPNADTDLRITVTTTISSVTYTGVLLVGIEDL